MQFFPRLDPPLKSGEWLSSESGDFEGGGDPSPSKRFKAQSDRVGALCSFDDDGGFDGAVDFLEPPRRRSACPFAHADDFLVEAQVFESGEERGDEPSLELSLVAKPEY